MNKKILDATCGGRSIWFDKNNPDTLYVDRKRDYGECKTVRGGVKHYSCEPDIIADFTDLPFEDNSFYLVVFDPPHLITGVETAWLSKLYGRLPDDWRDVIRKGFEECWRVLKPNGTLIFKWNEVQIPTREVIKAIGHDPLFGHRSGKKSQTHWMCFFKEVPSGG